MTVAVIHSVFPQGLCQPLEEQKVLRLRAIQPRCAQDDTGLLLFVDSGRDDGDVVGLACSAADSGCAFGEVTNTFGEFPDALYISTRVSFGHHLSFSLLVSAARIAGRLSTERVAIEPAFQFRRFGEDDLLVAVGSPDGQIEFLLPALDGANAFAEECGNLFP